MERYAALGGVCLNVGCIPSKALLHVAAVMDELQLTPLELIDRIAALVPPPRTHRYRTLMLISASIGERLERRF